MKKCKMKRKVVCVWGEWGEDTDFVIEPVCNLECVCEVCKDAFYIEKVEGGKE